MSMTSWNEFYQKLGSHLLDVDRSSSGWQRSVPAGQEVDHTHWQGALKIKGCSKYKMTVVVVKKHITFNRCSDLKPW